MTDIQKTAVSLHRSGFSCKRSVLRAAGKSIGLTEREAEGLGNPTPKEDIGKCGAVIAGLRILEKKYGEQDADTRKAAFEAAFREKNRSLLCRELRGKNGRSCTDYVSDAAEILDEMFHG